MENVLIVAPSIEGLLASLVNEEVQSEIMKSQTGSQGNRDLIPAIESL